MQVLNDFSELGPLWGADPGPPYKETHKQNKQPHNDTGHQDSDVLWIQPDSNVKQHFIMTTIIISLL